MALRLAWAYLRSSPGRTLILVLCIAATLTLPIAGARFFVVLEREMLARADGTPVVIGSPGSPADLMLHALYFAPRPPGELPVSAADEVRDSGLARPVPVYARFTAGGRPIVGTTLDYFDFRGIGLDRGAQLARLGDCVLGWEAARRLGVEPGDTLASDPHDIFDLGGTFPIRLRVRGVLHRTRSPDDHAVFVDLSTAWIIAGIGHGHDDIAKIDPDAERTDRGYRSGAQVKTHTVITDENIESFHFHGDPDTFPLTALIVVPNDDRARALLLARFVSRADSLQALRPSLVVADLVEMLVPVRRTLGGYSAVTAGVALALFWMIVALTLRLRRSEFETLHDLGCPRSTTAAIIACEIAMVLGLGLLIAGVVSLGGVELSRGWIRTMAA